jgi:hypothetical protein
VPRGEPQHARPAPGLERWFYAGAPAGGPGIRMSLIGYGSFQYEVKSGQRVTWPIIGLALQKNYISLYTSVIKDGAPITERHKGALGELRSGRGNFSSAVTGAGSESRLRVALDIPHGRRPGRRGCRGRGGGRGARGGT